MKQTTKYSRERESTASVAGKRSASPISLLQRKIDNSARLAKQLRHVRVCQQKAPSFLVGNGTCSQRMDNTPLFTHHLIGNPKQLKPKRNEKIDRAIAYRERLEQRQLNQLLTPRLAEQIDLINPGRDSERIKFERKKLQSAQEEDRVAWSKSLEANMHLLTDGYLPVLIPANGQGYDGLTSFSDRNQEIQVRFDADELADVSYDERVGRLAATFTHELVVHGSHLHGDPDTEHSNMSAPTERDAYFNASMNTFLKLDNDSQKIHFANEWSRDMFNQVTSDQTFADSGHTKHRRRQIRKERRQWIAAKKQEFMSLLKN